MNHDHYNSNGYNNSHRQLRQRTSRARAAEVPMGTSTSIRSALRSPTSTSPSANENNGNSVKSGNNPSSNNRNANAKQPTIHTTVSDLIWIICAYMKRFVHYLRCNLPRILRILGLVIVLVTIIVFSMLSFLVSTWLQDARPVCTPPSGAEASLSASVASISLKQSISDPSSSLLQHLPKIHRQSASASSHETQKLDPKSHDHHQQQQVPPLIEYYVHGRGNGHYARSVAIVEQLLNKGIDVRMFIGRATMYRAVNAAHGDGIPHHKQQDDIQGDDTHSTLSNHDLQLQPDDAAVLGKNMDSAKEGSGSADPDHDTDPNDHAQPDHRPNPPPADRQSSSNVGDKNEITKPKRRGELTVTSILSLLPSMGIFDSISLSIERIASDCEISKATNRYPILVITDGDVPGMVRAKLGSIPSVSVAHGQTFVVGQKPDWVAGDAVLNQAWNQQSRLNAKSSWGSDWLIGTNFVDIPMRSHQGNGVVARSPMRPEVMRMGRERQVRKKKGDRWMKHRVRNGEAWDVLALPGHGGGDDQGRHVKESFMSSWQKDMIDELLLGEEVMSVLRVVRNAIETKVMEPLEDTNLMLKRRRLVICYFRDKNGNLVTNALFRSGFDVLLFERGYHKGISDADGVKKFGQDLIVRREKSSEQHHHGQSTSGSDEDGKEQSPMEYWADTLEKNDRKFLEDDDIEQVRTAPPSDSRNISKRVHSSRRAKDNSEVNMNSREKYKSTEESVTLQAARDTLNSLLKSKVAEAPRIIRVTDMSLFVPLLSIADGVASSAGSQLLSECIYSHMNVLSLFREDDTEQRLNIAFSKHRFDRLSKAKVNKGGESGNDGISSLKTEKMGYFADENVVHGMSLENFASVFETISLHESPEFDTILTEQEEQVLLPTSEAKQTYNDFKTYVESIRQTPISWSYYHDLFHGIIKKETGKVIKDTKEDLDVDANEEGNVGHDAEGGEYIDPFHGMPEVAGIIFEIIDDIKKNQMNKQ